MAPNKLGDAPGKGRTDPTAPARGEPDNVPGNRLSQDDSSPNAPGGSEQPKNDRRKRGDLQKRRTHLPTGQ